MSPEPVKEQGFAMTLKTWLSLTVAVLLVHLVLLQRLPLNLGTAQPETTSRFVTRTVVIASATPPEAVTPANEPDKPKPKAKPAPKAAPIPVPPPVTVPPSVAAPEPPSATENASTLTAFGATATGIQADAIAAPITVASAASTPASAADALPAADVATTTPEPARTPEPEPAPTPTPTPTPTPEPVPQPDAVTSIQAVTFNPKSLPGSARMVFRAESNKFPYRLPSEMLWQQNGQTYQARVSIGAFGIDRVQTSRGLIDRHGLAPERFSDKLRSEVAAHFNRAQGVVTFSANTPDLPLQPGAQDRVSVTLQLAALVASAPQRFTPGTTLSVQTIGPRGGEVWLFTFGSMETLELPGGLVQGLKLWRQPRHPYDQKLDIWLAPELSYLPARLRITEDNGDYVDQKWEATKALDSP